MNTQRFNEIKRRVDVHYAYMQALQQDEVVMAAVEERVQLSDLDGKPLSQQLKMKYIFLADLYRLLIRHGHELGEGSAEELAVLMFAMRITPARLDWFTPESEEIFWETIAPNYRNLLTIPIQVSDSSTVRPDHLIMEEILKEVSPAKSDIYLRHSQDILFLTGQTTPGSYTLNVAFSESGTAIANAEEIEIQHPLNP